MLTLPLTSFGRHRAQTGKQWWSFAAFWTLVATIVVISCTVGAVFGYIKYFSDDGFAPQFALVREQNNALQDVIDTEQAARIAQDAIITAAQLVTQTALDIEIATRTEEDTLLLALVTAEVAARTAAQLALNNGLDAERDAREAFDTLAFAQMTNLTDRLNVLDAYNVYALQQFMIKMANLTSLDDRLAQETAERIGNDTVLTAQDTAQQNFIALFSQDLAAEIATRIAADLAQQAAIDAILGDGILTINNQSSLNHNYDFQSGNAGFTIGSGGTNVITITSNAIATIDGLTPDPVTHDISILADNNVYATPMPGSNNIEFGLVNIPPVPNYASYSGTWTGSSGTCFMLPNIWFFDANSINGAPSPSCPHSPFITDYTTSDGFAWTVPLSGGVGYGVWLVRVTMTLTMNYLGTPFGTAFTMGLCINTRAACIASPNINEPQGSLVWEIGTLYSTANFGSWGMSYQDHIFTSTYVLDGRGVAPTTSVYPVWQRNQGDDGFGGFPSTGVSLLAILVEYDITQLA